MTPKLTLTQNKLNKHRAKNTIQQDSGMVIMQENVL